MMYSPKTEKVSNERCSAMTPTLDLEQDHTDLPGQLVRDQRGWFNLNRFRTQSGIAVTEQRNLRIDTLGEPDGRFCGNSCARKYGEENERDEKFQFIPLIRTNWSGLLPYLPITPLCRVAQHRA